MKPRLFTFAVAYLIVIIAFAHFFAQPGYVWTQNTISELPSQGHTYKWIMQVGISGFGVPILLAVGQGLFKTKKMCVYCTHPEGCRQREVLQFRPSLCAAHTKIRINL